jgi:hypothetical protein
MLLQPGCHAASHVRATEMQRHTARLATLSKPGCTLQVLHAPGDHVLQHRHVKRRTGCPTCCMFRWAQPSRAVPAAAVQGCACSSQRRQPRPQRPRQPLLLLLAQAAPAHAAQLAVLQRAAILQ